MKYVLNECLLLFFKVYELWVAHLFFFLILSLPDSYLRDIRSWYNTFLISFTPQGPCRPVMLILQLSEDNNRPMHENLLFNINLELVSFASKVMLHSNIRSRCRIILRVAAWPAWPVLVLSWWPAFSFTTTFSSSPIYLRAMSGQEQHHNCKIVRRTGNPLVSSNDNIEGNSLWPYRAEREASQRLLLIASPQSGVSDILLDLWI